LIDDIQFLAGKECSQEEVAEFIATGNVKPLEGCEMGERSKIAE
jgi:hypothetical protein